MLDLITQTLRNRKPHILEHDTAYLKSAVMIPLIETKNGLSVLFEVRSRHLKRQPGEICFPGGKVDAADLDEQQAALRETCEELQLSIHDVRILGALDYLVMPAGLIVYPFVCHIIEEEKINPNPSEVEEIFLVPLEYLAQAVPKLHYVNLVMQPPDDFPFDWIPGGKNYPWRRGRIPEYFYFYADKIIWGLTARILRHFLTLYKSIERQVN